ncbi:MAG: peptidyl-prolyl cis-trans isomerase, partial [Myxococcaceae bacterium]|nr:peptidyl-prolyl cis-trans isomerase [Myxococcaceae bacterium]
ERLIKGDTAGGGQPLLALAQQGLPPAGKAVLVGLRDQLIAGQATATDPRIKKDLANIECRLAAAIDRINSEIREVLTCGATLIPENQRISTGLYEVAASPAKDPARRVEELSQYLTHGDTRVKLAAIHLLGENKHPAAVEKLKPLLTNSDLVLAAATVTALSRIGDKASIPAILPMVATAGSTVEIAPAIAEALEALDAKEAIPELQKWLTSPQATVRVSAATALTRLTGQPVIAARVEGPANLVKAAEVPKDAVLVVKTEKGDFEIKLYTQDAPKTAANMFTLAKSKFFKNLTFHRIVPDFVAQGGDPRGDGEGGPGYTIRCEINHRPYQRGVVGMALGGKDTGGSQFFVMLAGHPHLDGKYTSFGEVVRGQEVVDALLEGDRILEVGPPPPPPEK